MSYKDTIKKHKDWWKDKLQWQRDDDYEDPSLYHTHGQYQLPEHNAPPVPDKDGKYPAPAPYKPYYPPYDPKKSYASRWKEKLGGWWSTWEPGYYSYAFGEYSATLRMLEHATRQLARTANVLRNTKTGEEKPLYMKWGGQTQPDNQDIALNPDRLANAKPEDRDHIIDAMTGYVMLGSTMKRTIDRMAWHGYSHDRESKDSVGTIAAPMWESLETALARKEILTEWGGFLPYFEKHSEQTGAAKPMLEMFLAMNKPNAKGAASIIAWNMLNPQDPILPTPEYEEVVNDAIQCIAEGNDSAMYRYANCRAAARLILDKLPPEPQPNPPQPKPDGDGESGKKDKKQQPQKPKPESNKEEPEDGNGKAEQPKPPNPSEMPQVTDKDLFGSVVTAKDVSTSDMPDSINLQDFDPFDVIMPKGCPPLSTPPEHRFLSTTDAREYNNMVRLLAPQIARIKEALWFRNSERAQWSRGQLSGDLDEGGLHKLSIPDPFPAIWERRDVISIPRIAVCLLVDESGSMRSSTESSSDMKYIAARRVAVTMVEALRQIKGMSALVLGHTANASRRQLGENIKVDIIKEDVNGCVVLREFYGPDHKNPYACAAIGAYENNLDGYAMEHASRRFSKAYPNSPIKLMFVISDGQPAGDVYGRDGVRAPYGDTEAMEHMTRVCQWSRTVPKVQIYGIGVCNAYTNAEGKSMYGAGRFVVLKDVKSSLLVLTSFLRQIALKAEVQQEG